jgi:dihydrofolate reductase
MTGRLPTPAEAECAHVTSRTPHHVRPNTLTSTLWPRTSFVCGLADIAALEQRGGKDICLVGGARTTVSLIDAGLVGEIRLIAYPLIAGAGKSLFSTAEHRRLLAFRDVRA